MPSATPIRTDWPDDFRRFAHDECPTQASTAALCRALADWPALHDAMALVPPAQARVNLLLATVHERVLAGAGGALADYFPSVGGTRAPDAELPSALFALLMREQDAMHTHLQTRATQTNETGRCAVLRLALDALVAHTGQRQLALFDFGASAGLNLGVDADRVELATGERGPGTRLHLVCDWRGGTPPPAQGWRLVARAGTDLAPLNPSDPAERRWLEACTWTDDTVRLARLRQALTWGDAAVRAGLYQVTASVDGLSVLSDWLGTLPVGLQPVLFNSWVLAYFDDKARAAYRDRVQAMVDQHDLAWLCAEAHSAHPLADAATAAPEASATLWTLQTRAGTQALMWSHPHGAWARAA